MEIGLILLIAALACSIVDIGFLALRRRWKMKQRYSRSFIYGSSLFTWASLLLLLKYIFDNNFSFKYIVEHSSIALAPELKLSVLWTGQEGSLLLWAALTFVFYVIYRQLFSQHIDNKLVYRSFIIASIFCSAFLILSLISHPFVSVDIVPMDGWGLNPLLRTAWNIVHPPIVFVAYAALLVPFSIAMAAMTPHAAYEDLPHTRKIHDFLDLQMAASWTFLTLGIIIGGYWAYITLGWGGYWAWDPVETTSLIAWLLCTGYFHVKNLFTPYGLGTQIIVFFTFLSVFFATFVTRSGIITSVHGFTESLVAQSFVGIMLGSVVTFASFLGYQLASQSFSFIRFKEKMLGSRLMLALFISLICIIGSAVVSMVGVIYPILLSATSGNQYSMDQSFFNNASSFFVLGLLGSTFFCSFPNPKHSRLLLTIVGIGIGLGFSTLYVGLPTSSPLANFLLPITLISLLGASVKLVRDFVRMSNPSALFKSSSRTILHLGFILILFGVLISSNTQVSTVGWTMTCCSVDLGSTSVEIDEIILDVQGFDSYTIEARVLVFDNGELTGGGNVYHVVESGWGSYCQLNIFSTFWRDVYVSLHDAQVDPLTGEITDAYLEVQVIPLVALVWAGCILTIIAISSMFAMYSIQFARKYQTSAPIRKAFSLISNK
jgi:cytochrome c-type biogenesis protein CcmF